MEARKGRNVDDYKSSSISKLIIFDSTNAATLRIIHPLSLTGKSYAYIYLTTII
jgi:hypothetical protein